MYISPSGVYSCFQFLILLFNLIWEPDGGDVAVFYAVAFAWGITDAMAHVGTLGIMQQIG